jgi:DNA helicase-2/ATP-dependent DNA helicase PcrA
MLYGRTSPNPPSRFLAEIPEELLELPKPTPGSAPYAGAQARTGYTPYQNTAARDRITVGPTRSSGATTATPTFKVGDRVHHVLFGDGDIISAQQMGTDCLYEIVFDTKGTKKLMAKYAKLKKI